MFTVSQMMSSLQNFDKHNAIEIEILCVLTSNILHFQGPTADQALVSLGLVHNSLPRNTGSTAALLDSDSDSCADSEFGAVPVYAANPHVKLPAGVTAAPVPVPRTSLQLQQSRAAAGQSGGLARATSDNGCDSDTDTIDIRIRDPEHADKHVKHKSGAESNWSVSELDAEEDEDWEVKEESSDNDNITDIDTTSIITDGIAQQMMY